MNYSNNEIPMTYLYFRMLIQDGYVLYNSIGLLHQTSSMSIVQNVSTKQFKLKTLRIPECYPVLEYVMKY